MYWSSAKSLISTYSIFGGGGLGVGTYLSLSGRGRGRVGWWHGACLFETGFLLTFSAFRMGAYLRWGLIRVWVLILINMVSSEVILKYTCL